jgi:hypothetical protein
MPIQPISERNDLPQIGRIGCWRMNFGIDRGESCGIWAVSRRQSGRPRTFALLGSNRMKKIAFVLAAAGLMSVAACSKSPEAAAVENNGDMLADNMEMQADNMDAMADNTSNAAAAATLENAADNMNAAADNVRDAADAKADNM